jgi:hypothetical protein
MRRFARILGLAAGLSLLACATSRAAPFQAQKLEASAVVVYHGHVSQRKIYDHEPGYPPCMPVISATGYGNSTRKLERRKVRAVLSTSSDPPQLGFGSFGNTPFAPGPGDFAARAELTQGGTVNYLADLDLPKCGTPPPDRAWSDDSSGCGRFSGTGDIFVQLFRRKGATRIAVTAGNDFYRPPVSSLCFGFEGYAIYEPEFGPDQRLGTRDDPPELSRPFPVRQVLRSGRPWVGLAQSKEFVWGPDPVGRTFGYYVEWALVLVPHHPSPETCQRVVREIEHIVESRPGGRPDDFDAQWRTDEYRACLAGRGLDLTGNDAWDVDDGDLP